MQEKAHSGKEATCIKFNSSGSLIATAGGDSLVKLWDVQPGSSCDCIETLRCFAKPVSCLAFAPMTDMLMCCSVDRQIKFYSTK